MKNSLSLKSLFLLVFPTLLISCAKSVAAPEDPMPSPSPVEDQIVEEPQSEDEKVIVAYVTSWSSVIPDPTLFTHLNYAFGHVNDTFDGIRIDNPDRLRKMVKLKEENPQLKVLLSVGGWGSGNFSEMAASGSLRKSFAKSCRQIIKDYNLDGIDIDWEYPTIDWAGISSSPSDTENYTLLMNDIRKEIGDDKLLTLASSATARYINFRSILPVVDFVNLMTYDMSDGDKHHAPLYSSPITTDMNAALSVKAHLDNGVPNEKIVLGIPFYGRGIRNNQTYYSDYKDIQVPAGCTLEWDDTAMAPYIADKDGNFMFGFDDTRSVAIKCQYILDNNLKGAMYWDYNGDDAKKSLSTTIHSSLME